MTFIIRLIGAFSDHAKARWMLRRGINQARKKQYKLAAESYATVIEMSAKWPEIKEQALYDRALAYVALGDNKLATIDLEAILQGGNASINTATMARQALAKIDVSSHSTRS